MPKLEPKRLRVVERLAFRMYEESDPGSIPWLQRGWTVRAVWLKKAQEKLQGGGSADRLAPWWDVWGRIKLMYL